ncbi:response regulator transcription factor [Vreelandella populi]|uniref:Response regulator n=1 Tax=Vreelandella populi TaxID=2498858 RepID=A0A3S0YE59_9GAMM|nr:response regulator [Halomonas populi]RUR35727.1 response regulator [Halomonas populi]RUR47918.1 response regulator [Halomonas populi]
MKRILIVDDAATVRLFNRQILEAAGYRVDEAVNGIEALEKALQAPYDLYLVDVNMPMQDGFSFLRQLRAQAIAQAPAVMITTEAGEQDRRQAWAAGANYYLTKPIKPDVLLHLVRLLTGGAA